MLECQREHFEMPREVCYLNAAGWSPLPRKTVEVGRAGAARKAQPWMLAPGLPAEEQATARSRAAALINADPNDVALIPSIAYGVATAAKALPISRGSRVVVIEDDHSSPVLEWMTRSEQEGFTVEIVRRPADGDWTSAVLAAITRSGARPLALLSVSSVHWSDGGAVDIAALAPAARALGAAVLVDFTHSAGVTDLDVRVVDPDFVMFPTYKWLLGPYGRAFLYVAKRHQGAIPLEQTSAGRRNVSAEAPVYFGDLRHVADARRFDMGERDHFVSLPMASASIAYVQTLGVGHIRERLQAMTTRMASALAEVAGVRILDARFRVPHILCLGFADGMPAGIIERLEAEKIHVAPRVGRIRISPHVYTDEHDVDRFTAAVARMMRG
jgi:selenocysteine lyase/cysteine desulfurase